MYKVPVSKRLFDVIFASIGIIITSPLLLLISILCWIFQGRPILFKQLRPGLNNKPFNIYKFRSMKDVYDANGKLLPDEQRITRFGQFLRSTSLDELPSLFNVIKGDMSIVGPRPLLMQYLGRYNPEQARRQHVLPGITGWSQINGRNAISWEEKFRYDVWYVDNWSLWLDIKIIIITIWKVLKREGINQKGHATMEEFMGNPEQNA